MIAGCAFMAAEKGCYVSLILECESSCLFVFGFNFSWGTMDFCLLGLVCKIVKRWSAIDWLWKGALELEKEKNKS